MLTRLRSLLRALSSRTRLEDDMNFEMRFHVQAYTDDLVSQGVPLREAKRRARIEFGSVENAKQECRESRGLRFPDELARNIRYALRTLCKTPGFALAAIVTLALCIGANTAIFSVIDAALLRPLPYPEPDRLADVVLEVRAHGLSGLENSQDGETFELVRDHARGIDVAAMGGGFTGVNLAIGGRAQYVEQHRVSTGYFRVLGVAPVIGREFTKEEDRDGGPASTILSHDLWARVFASDPNVLGRTVLLRGEPHAIVGVMPGRFRSIVHTDLWTPLRPSTRGEGGGSNYGVIARLRPGTSLAQGSAEVEALGRPMLDRRRTSEASAKLALVSLQQGLMSDMSTPLYSLWVAVGLVLLIGCLNIAGLMLVRAAGRTREIATRVALGGGQGAVIRQLLTESLVISILGGAAGVVAGYAGIRVLSVFAEEALGVWQDLRLDWRVLAMTAALSVLTSIVFGLLPAIKSARVDVRSGLLEGGGRGVAGGGSRWPRRLLVLAEVALGMVLLAGAGLMIRTFVQLLHLSPGFDASNVLAASLSLQDAHYRTAGNANRLFDESLNRIRALPGVEGAAVGLHVPYERWLNMGFKQGAAIGTDHWTTMSLNYVTPQYFSVLRIPLSAGRDFSERDSADSPPVAIVSESFAKRYLKGEQPVGLAVQVSGEKQLRQIVGVAGDLQQRQSWESSNSPLVQLPTMYIPASQVSGKFLELVHTWFSPKWVVRSAGSQQAVMAAMRKAVEKTDPLLPFASFKNLTDIRDQTLTSQRLQTILLGSLAALALVLAAVGVYGLIANTAAQRTREMGIRMALGASLSRLILSIALPGVLLGVTGVAAGSVLALWSVRAVRSAVYGVATLDPATFAAVAAILLGVATAASFLPALKMTRLNPASTLRDE